MERNRLARSMSKKCYPPDNTACEGFFGRLKNEMFYGRPWQGVSIDAFIREPGGYLSWYDKKRSEKSLLGKSPVGYRSSISLVV